MSMARMRKNLLWVNNQAFPVEAGTNLQQPGELDPEQDDLMAESESSDEDELAQETMEYPSRNDERESFDLPLMSFATPPDSATHEQLGLVSNVEDSVDDDQENVQDRKSEISAGRGGQIDQQRLELPEEIRLGLHGVERQNAEIMHALEDMKRRQAQMEEDRRQELRNQKQLELDVKLFLEERFRHE